jgi:AraC family transcriptional regulator of adaptative response / DNA-3-methyladenine glycosylase II
VISFVLSWRPPYEWPAMLGYLTARATPGVEQATTELGGRYLRTVQLQGARGHVALCPSDDGVQVELSDTLAAVREPLTARLRSLLDLDADPAVVAAHLAGDPVLAPLVARRPGLRVPGALDGFELALRTMLGQQVTVRGATTLAGRLAALVGEPIERAPSLFGAHLVPLTRLAVTAERLAEARVDTVAGIGLPRARAQGIVALARAVADGGFPELTGETCVDLADFRRRLTALPGVGAWTAEYVVMRALRQSDAFPDTDLVLRRATGGLAPARLRAAAERWRPWRAYAAQHLWAAAAGPVRLGE